MSNVIKNPLDFEKNLTIQEAHLEELKERLNAGDEDIRKEYAELEKKVTKLRKETYEDLRSILDEYSNYLFSLK